MDNSKVIMTGIVAKEPMIIGIQGERKLYRTEVEITRKSGTVDTVPLIYINTSDTYKFIEELKNNGDVIVGQLVDILGYLCTRTNNGKLFVSVMASSMSYAQVGAEHKNKVMFTGYIGKLLDIRTTPLGSNIIDATIAINRMGRSYYVPVIIWNGLAKNFKERHNVGDKVSLIGRFQSREYRKVLGIDDAGNEQAETRVAYEVSINNVLEN